MRVTLVLISVLLVLSGCAKEGGKSSSGAANGSDSPGALAPLEQMRKDIETLQAKEELEAQELTVQHILIAFAGANARVKATRSKEEAEALAADIYRRVLEGEDFRGLMSEHSDDTGGGIYVMVSDPANKVPGQKWFRGDMVPAFGNVGWRLKVGETGVAPYHPQDSIFGWHIVQRIE